MAKIILTFYNGLLLQGNNKIPAFYESFIKCLENDGNLVKVYQHQFFAADFDRPSDKVISDIIEFDPDLVILFNNAFPDISSIVDCPIVVYEVDSPRVYSNKEKLIKNQSKYLFFLTDDYNKETLISWGIEPQRIYIIPFFTEIHAKDEKLSSNISFIGSIFTRENHECINDFMMAGPNDFEIKIFELCIEAVRNNPRILLDDLRKLEVPEYILKYINLNEIITELSDEKRMGILSAVVPLGLKIYGTESWGKRYFFNSPLNLSYRKKQIASIDENQWVYNSSKIGISIAHLQAVNAFPWRVMDIMASNACLVSDYHPKLDEYFKGTGLIYANTPSEAYDVCNMLINDDEKRMNIVKKCNKIIDEKYRFANLKDIIEAIVKIKI